MVTKTKSPLVEAGLERHEGGSLADYFRRRRTWAFGDRVLDTDSVELVRQSRAERDEEILQARGSDKAESSSRG